MTLPSSGQGTDSKNPVSEVKLEVPLKELHKRVCRCLNSDNKKVQQKNK